MASKKISCAHLLAFSAAPGVPEVTQSTPGGPTGPQMVAKSSQKAKNCIKMVKNLPASTPNYYVFRFWKLFQIVAKGSRQPDMTSKKPLQ